MRQPVPPAPRPGVSSPLTRVLRPGARLKEAAGGGAGRGAQPSDDPDQRQPPVPRPASPDGGGGSGGPEPARGAPGRHLGPRAALRLRHVGPGCACARRESVRGSGRRASGAARARSAVSRGGNA